MKPINRIESMSESHGHVGPQGVKGPVGPVDDPPGVALAPGPRSPLPPNDDDDGGWCACGCGCGCGILIGALVCTAAFVGLLMFTGLGAIVVKAFSR